MFYIAGLAVIVVGTILLAPEIVWILGGSKYLSATPLIPFFIVAVFIQAVTSLFTVILTYEKKIVKIVIFTIVAAIVSVIGKIVLMPKYGLEVLPIINVVIFSILFLFNYALVRKTVHSAAINIKGTAIVIILMGILAFFASILYEHTRVRYIVIGVLIVGAIMVIFKYRKMLLNTINAVRKRS